MTDPLDPFEQAPADLASGARARTAELRRSPRVRRALAAGGGAALGAGAVWLLVLAPSRQDDTREVRTVDETTTTVEASATTTSAPTTSESVVPVSDDTAPSTTEVVTTTVEEPPPEPRCEIATGEPRSFAGWAEYYQTDPGDDQPVSMRLCVDDVTPRVGQVVTVTVAANDPDAVDSHRLTITVTRADQDFDMNSITMVGNTTSRTINFNTRAGLNADEDIPKQSGMYMVPASFDENSATFVLVVYANKSVVGSTWVSGSILDTAGTTLWSG